jgi:RNA polymerase sigma-70 factor (ECF subfamily)
MSVLQQAQTTGPGRTTFRQTNTRHPGSGYNPRTDEPTIPGVPVDAHQLDDKRLIALIVEEQQDALSILYDRYSRLVYSMAYRTVGDSGLAEEVTQEVFLRVWEKASTYRPDQAKVITWIASITRYRAIDILRKRKIRPEGNQADWDEGQVQEKTDPADVEQIVELRQRRTKVRAALAELPEDQRHALALAFFYGYSHSQIAETLQEPLGTIKTRIRSGMQKLRSLLDYEQEI